MVGVNRREGIPVPGNFLLGTVLWRVLVLHELFDPLDWCFDSLDAVGGFGALYDGHLTQRFEHLGCLLHEQCFFPPVLAQQADSPQK